MAVCGGVFLCLFVVVGLWLFVVVVVWLFIAVVLRLFVVVVLWLFVEEEEGVGSQSDIPRTMSGKT